MSEEYISKIKDQYIIKRTFNDIEYTFGCCKTIDEAIILRNQLDKDGWPINSKVIKKNSVENMKNDNKEFDKFEDSNNYHFDIKIGKAYKHGFLVLSRKNAYELFPKISYEDGCDIVFDGIKSKARLNFVPRIVIDKKNEELINRLKELNNIDPNQRGIVTLIKQENNNTEASEKIIEENEILKKKINKLKEEITFLYNLSKE